MLGLIRGNAQRLQCFVSQTNLLPFFLKDITGQQELGVGSRIPTYAVHQKLARQMFGAGHIDDITGSDVVGCICFLFPSAGQKCLCIGNTRRLKGNQATNVSREGRSRVLGQRPTQAMADDINPAAGLGDEGGYLCPILSGLIDPAAWPCGVCGCFLVCDDESGSVYSWLSS